ncbi:DEAD/DEAH box helicase [Aeromicrobium sp. A1-2]|uniref:DEAD/DEAH box helicase family protein n=1 Tax=Aeromicrobium sp. A1-2 TaxID=2107713 RepID=UPI000E521749|nr:DEAD/DEAH box helicase family protein [Aeromicrobium sp. A1-2]AXT86095.1 DEAD/DEAH box helicase [Aeromicrobium sp. A1-2]
MALADDFASTSAPFALRTLQVRSLEAVHAAMAAGRRRLWVSLPPGTGKTLLGLELVRRLGHPVVALTPNTAIQGQWVQTWSQFEPVTVPAGTDRDLSSPVTVLTYQSLATFERTDDEADDAEDPQLVDRLHENGRRLITSLRDAGPITIVLDECHHLLEVWGRLLAEVLADLPEATVIGLTATPPTVLDARQAALVDELFGDIVFSASIPAAVREGHLAPFAELAWLTLPTAEESAWLRDQSMRFVQLTTDLVDTRFGSIPILVWFDRRFLDLTTPWTTFERDDPDLARAALRLVHAELLALPDGARLREEHRQGPTADDWAALIDDWVRKCLSRSGVAGDEAVMEALRKALPGVGYQLTRTGVRRGRSPVDRVIARSESKMRACQQVLEAEHANLGERLRSLVLCDHEMASATTPTGLRPTPARSGSARQTLRHLVASGSTHTLRPILVTGRNVASTPNTAQHVIDLVRMTDPALADRLVLNPLDDAIGDDGLVTIDGPWSSREWVRVVTQFFESGGSQVLIGTRALLGEGWDAKGLNSLVDLTTATTTSAVVQTRGRALRLDPSWPGKVAITWSIACVAPDHPRGDGDWQRLVRKHQGFFGVDDLGEVIYGIAHIDARFSPFAAPAAESFDAIDADMLTRAEEREVVRERWAVGTPYDDALVHTLRVRPSRPSTRPSETVDGHIAMTPPAYVPGQHGPVSTRPHVSPRLSPWKSTRAAAADPGTMAYACAVADAMLAAGMSPFGADHVEATIDPGGEYRLRLDGVDEPTSQVFVESLDELLGPVRSPRYLVTRHLYGKPGWIDGWRTLLGRLRPDAHVWHAVPTVFGTHGRLVRHFDRAWSRWITDSSAVYAHSPEGVAALSVSAGTAPLELVTVMRSAWS